MFTVPFGARVGAQGRRTRRAAAVLASLALILGLAACGVTPSAPGSALERPCNGPDGSVSDIGTVTLVLSTSSPMATGTPGAGGSEPYEGSAHVGDIVQVQLPTTNRWSLSTAGGGVTLLSPAAQLDTRHSVCFWNFKATATGDTTLTFEGGARCAPSQPCPLYARLASFLVQVS